MPNLKYCTKCGVSTDYSGDLHCRKNFISEINGLIKSNDLEKAKHLFYAASFNEDWKKILLYKIGGEFEKLIMNEKCTSDASKIIRKLGLGIVNADNRFTHCYNCKSFLDNAIHKECNICHWIICGECGACGCGYDS